MKQNWQCKVANSLGDGFAGDVYSAWGVAPYTDDTQPTVFFGCYGLPDFYAIWRHKGPKAILWAGSDIRHLQAGYWLDDKGAIKLNPYPIAEWINLHCDSYVENDVEKNALWCLGIQAKAVIPSFLGNVDDYPPQVHRTDKQRYYTSVSGDDFELYGWYEIPKLATENPDTEYHLYGSTNGLPEPHWYFPNIINHGRVSQEQMDEETRTMTGALRLTKFDGFSEILAKSYLWGQQPLSPYIKYPYKNREDLLQVLNKYPWASN